MTTPAFRSRRGATPPGRPARAVFLDKDGTLVVDVPYNVDPARLRFTPHAAEALKLLADAGYALWVATNQPGLATGRFDAAAFDRLQQSLVARVRDEAGVTLAGFLVCPHAPGIEGEPVCACRKPAPGLLRQAARTHGIDLAASWMVGDILNDVEAGRRAGCRTVLLDVGNETEWRPAPPGSLDRTPHHVCADLFDAARVIVARDLGEPDAGLHRNPPGAAGRDDPREDGDDGRRRAVDRYVRPPVPARAALPT